MDEKNSYFISQINAIALHRGNIHTAVTSTSNYNIYYIGESSIKVFQTFWTFALSNALFQLILSSLLNCCFIILNHVLGGLPLGRLNSCKT